MNDEIKSIPLKDNNWFFAPLEKREAPLTDDTDLQKAFFEPLKRQDEKG